MNALHADCLQQTPNEARATRRGTRFSRWPGRIAIVLIGLSASLAGVQPPHADISPEDEVLANLRDQKIGRHTLADLNLPEEFLRREADRIIRASFEERYRIVVKDPLSTTEDGHAPAPAILLAKNAAPGAIDVFEPTLTAEALAYRRNLSKARPSNRGFIPMLRESDVNWPMEEPDDAADQPLRDAADHVGKRLAIDGLLTTLVHVIALLGPEQFIDIEDGDMTLLRATGLPIDLLRHFTLASGENNLAIITRIANALKTGPTIEAAFDAMRDAKFAFIPTKQGFAVADDAGSVEPAVIRAQVTRGGYWRGIHDGGTTDLIRQSLAALPDVPFVASVEIKHARGFLDIAATWPLTRDKQLTLVTEPMEVQQWTQDNAKAGTIEGTSHAMLVPRYASWGDDGSTFLAGETFLLPGAAEAIGATLIHSPLLFQGGNILCVQNSLNGGGGRLLLVADADIYRNTALGLTVEQAIEAFRIEFSCDRCVMLPALSFHLDYDVSIRIVDGKMIALVNDPLAAAKIVLECGTTALVQAGRVSEPIAKEAIAALQRGEHRGYLQRIAPLLYAAAPDGRYPLSLAEKFSTSPMDSGVGNLQRFLLAIDFLVSLDLRPEEMPGSRHARSYLQSLARREQHRQTLHTQLRELGMAIHAVPSMSDATRGFAFLNGLQLKSMFVMPAYGGLFTPLDDAAESAIRSALGTDLRIVRIECSESQRRSGAVRCSLSVFPKVPNAGTADDAPRP